MGDLYWDIPQWARLVSRDQATELCPVGVVLRMGAGYLLNDIELDSFKKQETQVTKDTHSNNFQHSPAREKTSVPIDLPYKWIITFSIHQASLKHTPQGDVPMYPTNASLSFSATMT